MEECDVEFWLKQQANRNGDAVFIDNGKTKLTFNSCYQRATHLAYSIHNLNQKRVGMYIDNSIESIILIQAAWLAGVEIAMLNTRLTETEMQNQMHSIDVEVILTTSDLTLDGFDIYTYAYLITCAEEQSYEAPFDINRIASIMFTSGTTGPQKAVPQTFANHYASAIGCEQSLGFDANTKWLSVLPIYHISGLSVILRALIAGFTVRIEPKFNTQQILHIISEESPTHVSLVPQTLKWLMDAGLTQPYNIEKILLGGAKLSAALINQALSNKLPIYNSFGMTETCSQFLTASPTMLEHRPDTVGKPSDNVQVKIVRPDNKGHGELVIKGNNVMEGYLYPNELNAIDEQGYFNTGDIAEIDDEGFVMVYDRRKDLIISGGENIYPFEIESVAKACKDVEDAMCVGTVDDIWGEVPYLYYVAKDTVKESQLQDYLQNHLAKYKVPKYLKRVSALPYTSTGKLQRQHL
jgi:o-succinylbenzoate---CoA ligase|nr:MULTISPECIES: o-succinylbenzoate--CoA ligase [unclassified Staphylococcus]